MKARMYEGDSRGFSVSVVRESGAKRPYQAPKLIDLGEIRELTLGASGGTLESGDPPRKGDLEP
jgi:hypothetical protein